VLELQDGTRKSDKQFSYSLESASNQPTHWLILCWSTFGARTNHKRLRTHKTHHGLDSREAITFPHIVYFAPLHEGYIQMAFCPGTVQVGRGVPKLPRLEFLQLCGAITSCLDLRSGQGLKQICSSCRELSNGVLHATCMHGNRVDSQHFVVGSQTASLTLDLFLAITCYRCSNGSCEPILDFFTSIAF
jgi:hypothetical protein